MDDSSQTPWTASPTVKAKNAVQRNVMALLDELAPERVLTRGEQLKVRVERHRTPTGCVLQAATAALSVSWFTDADSVAPLGELHVVVWRGIVSRRGSPPSRDGATIVKELVFQPLEPASDGRVWRATDGKEYNTSTLAENCLALLEEQIVATLPTKSPPE